MLSRSPPLNNIARRRPQHTRITIQSEWSLRLWWHNVLKRSHINFGYRLYIIQSKSGTIYLAVLHVHNKETINRLNTQKKGRKMYGRREAARNMRNLGFMIREWAMGVEHTEWVCQCVWCVFFIHIPYIYLSIYLYVCSAKQMKDIWVVWCWSDGIVYVLTLFYYIRLHTI